MPEFHVGLLVNNVFKLTKFYQNIFGRVPDVIIENEYLEYPLKHNLIVDIEALQLVKDDIGDVSDRFYLRLEIEDIEKLHVRCKQENVEIVSGPKTTDYGKIEMYLRDPEGNLIQCFQKI